MNTHGVNYMIYADDTQLYLSLDQHDSQSAGTRLEECVDDISSWMAHNKLKLNGEKTEI